MKVFLECFIGGVDAAVAVSSMNVTSTMNVTVASVTAGTIASNNYIDGRLTKATEVIHTIFPPTLLTTVKTDLIFLLHVPELCWGGH